MLKITIDDLNNGPKDEVSARKLFVEWLHLFEEEQDKPTTAVLAMCGLINIERITGFLFCYQMISKKLKAQAVDEPEAIFKKEGN